MEGEMDRYEHIAFRKQWEISPDSCFMLGECHAIVHALKDIPLKPEYRKKLLSVSLIKGAQATTAIEGNTLSEEEIEKIQEGWKLPPSKEYLQIEVNNILSAFNVLLFEVVKEHKEHYITPDLIKHFHLLIGKDLGEYFDAIPGHFRTDRRFVGPYLAPEHQYVPELITELCEWVKNEFHYQAGQSFSEAVIEAIVTHVYIEWIHPFGDGNGRTGRLIEFYILLRSGLPSIVSHILSNFYNQTRSEYYKQLDYARKKRDLTNFVQYAIRGFRDGLKENLNIIQHSQFSIFWEHYIYEIFAEIKYSKSEVFKRKRALVLQMPLGKPLTSDELMQITPDIAKRYASVGRATLARDLKELQALKLIVKEGKYYMANTMILHSMMPDKK
jgi:Fic family protein